MTEQDVLEALREIYDPELGVNIVDLGLVYDVEIDDGTVHIRMTLTSPGCPLGATIEREVRQTFHLLPAVRDLDLQLVWDPPWGLERINEAGREALGIA
jgi:metal-sulfur cluster biosynthetic enzyme